MDDRELAKILIDRLNDLIKDYRTREAISTLLGVRAVIHRDCSDHPTIQTGGSVVQPTLSFLGLLNGIVGVIPSGRKKGYGYITVVLDDDAKLERFELTDSPIG